MENTPPADISRVRVSRRLKASRQRVYRAWTEPELMMRWFVETDYDMRIVRLDLRVGGTYRFEGEHEGQGWVLEGEFLEVRPAERLVYTWKWETDKNLGGPGDTVVTVDFREAGAEAGAGEETELTVTQEGFTNALARTEHSKGWIGCLNRLEGLVARDAGREA